VRLKDHNLKIAKSILNYLAEHQGDWTGLWHLEFVGREEDFHGNMKIGRVYDVAEAMPIEWTPRRRLAMMRVIYRNGLVGGCDCGCRGDFEITDRGLKFIGLERTAPYTGYGEVPPYLQEEEPQNTPVDEIVTNDLVGLPAPEDLARLVEVVEKMHADFNPRYVYVPGDMTDEELKNIFDDLKRNDD
jgi:hypothetical protein